MTCDLVAFVKEMDRCWLEGRFEDLSAYVAEDAVIASADGKNRVEGFEAFVGGYREFMSRCDVREFDTGNYTVAERGDAAVVEYDWSMRWEDNGEAHDARGREVLVLARRDGRWLVVWRMQLAR